MRHKRNMKELKQTWLSEFQEFLEISPVAVPRHLTERILGQIHRLLTPTFLSVFVRLSLVHAIASIFTLSICPQFGIQILPGVGGLTALFMKSGAGFCMFACGIFFMAVGILCGLILLLPEQLKMIRKHHLLTPILLTFFSEIFLVMFGKEFLLSGIAFWLLGGLFGSFLSLALGILLQFRRVHVWT